MASQELTSPLTKLPDGEEEPYDDVSRPVNTGKYPPFGALAGLYEKLSSESKHDMRRKLLGNWFRKWREEVGPDLYPVLRLLLPQKDRERAVYNIKEKTLAKIYIRIIPLNPKDEDALRLMNWKKPSEKDKTAGDFPMVLFEVISKRSNVMEGSLNIQRLNNLLDELSRSGGKMDQQTTIITTIYNNCTPAEQRWIVRIILKDLIISVKETTVLSVFHEDAMALFNTCSDLKRVSYQLCNPTKRLTDNEKTVTLCQAFAPMLCKRPTARVEDTVKLMGGMEFIIEEKLDGERMQLHKKGHDYFYCSRKGKDYTYLYGKTVGEGSLTPYIDEAFDASVDSIILDGEMLVWDPVTERHLPFGTLKTAALDKSKKELRPRPCLKIFDILYLNGRSLIDINLARRKERMRKYVSQIQGRLEYVQEFKGKTAKDIRMRMDEIIEKRGEGLILKRPDAKYTLNGRNIDFVKVKPEYMDDMGETVDVLVVAGNWGSGKRGGGVSTLICAVRDDRHAESDDDDEAKYSSFVRIGSGLTYADYVWIRAKPWKPWVKDDPPSFFQTAKKGSEDKGDMYLEPEDSFVIKVKAAEIVTSDQYHLNLTMRFPRALAVRDDLSVEDCLTATALFESLQSARKRKASDSPEGRKKRKGNAKPVVLPQYQGANVKGLDVKSSILEGMKFQVTPDLKSPTAKQDKHELETLIYLHGGDYSQLPKKDTSMIVYDGATTPPSIASIIKKGQLDIIRSAWIKDSVAKGKLLPCSKRYFFHATEARRMEDDYHFEDSDADDVIDTATSESLSGPSVLKAGDETMEEDGETVLKRFESPEDGQPTQDPEANRGRPEEETFDYDSDNTDINDEDVELLDMDGILATTDSKSMHGEEVNSSAQAAEEPDNADMTLSEESAMEYDQNPLFQQLYFYLDTAVNAKTNNMSVDENRKWISEIAEGFREVEEQIIKHRGKIIVDLDDSKITHVLYDKRDESRRIQLLRKTSKPKRRHVIMTDWVTSSIAQGGLLDEAHFS